MTLYRDNETGAAYRLLSVEDACGVAFATLEAVEPGTGVPPSKRLQIDEATGVIDGHERIED